MEIYAVIMAGGVGSRFWPRSREKKPKQLLQIFGDRTMIQQTVDRVKEFIPAENILIITNIVQKQEIIEQLPELNKDNIIAEPLGKNTAPCIGLASVLVSRKIKDAVTIVLPADHLIIEKDNFLNILRDAANFAYNHKKLITIGIQPTRPETGYGYIEIDKNQPVEEKFYKVVRFTEKPNLEKAKEFLQTGNFMWNSGMFVWRVDTILDEIKNYLPEQFVLLEVINKKLNDNLNLDDILNDVYPKFSSISIDYGIMEKSKEVFLIKSNFTWNDVGSWEEVYNLSQKDENNQAVTAENYFSFNSKNNYIYVPKKFVGLVGVENLIIIDTPDALLICNKDNAQDVKKIVDDLKNRKLDEYC
ncbi:MAG TPA: mannose-1-phosphate guanylyltransferase [Ignavibacteriales bacterium]|nr:mannose-1-phosphate guanylyltransferase [Ignavibacteriales bacterium]HOL80563.1 mannose-1-phosphate guanylyltransferase [Ignavibacteriales bacterium]HOM64253.1 mannose-1-phosphate guanylyltransferase [Ignavibacteriales bacterium]HPD67273.1 mannose-1-phosphate guanylyltransferase [Ignavibacteriales bacterium]HPP33101.1 mannose-1-phosphate guanylyltransferase [Ignavibacteriales bacterium]